MRLVLGALVAAAFLVAAPVAEAKLCVAIDAPGTARSGAALTVLVATFAPTWDGLEIVGRDPEPATVPLRLALRGPDGTYRLARLRWTGDPSVRRATVRLWRPGTWTISVLGWERAPRACAPRVSVRVR